MRIIIIAAVSLLLSMPAMAYIPDKGDVVVSRFVQTVSVHESGDMHLNTQRDTYTTAVSGCELEDLEKLKAPVDVKTNSRSIREGSTLTFIGADGEKITCNVELVSLL